MHHFRFALVWRHFDDDSPARCRILYRRKGKFGESCIGVVDIAIEEQSALEEYEKRLYRSGNALTFWSRMIFTKSKNLHNDGVIRDTPE